MKRYSTAFKIGGTALLMIGACLILVFSRSDAHKPVLLSHELEWKGERPVKSSIRDFYTSTVFERYRFSGTFSDTIMDLMDESLKYTPDKFTQVGGFVIDGTGIKEMPIHIDVSCLDALEIINELCRQAKCNWTLAEYGGIRLSRGPVP